MLIKFMENFGSVKNEFPMNSLLKHSHLTNISRNIFTNGLQQLAVKSNSITKTSGRTFKLSFNLNLVYITYINLY